MCKRQDVSQGNNRRPIPTLKKRIQSLHVEFNLSRCANACYSLSLRLAQHPRRYARPCSRLQPNLCEYPDCRPLVKLSAPLYTRSLLGPIQCANLKSRLDRNIHFSKGKSEQVPETSYRLFPLSLVVARYSNLWSCDILSQILSRLLLFFKSASHKSLRF